jgi:protein SCO1
MKKILSLVLLSLPAISFMISFACIADELPTDSLYQVQSSWQTEKGDTVSLKELESRHQIIALVYTHCISICPLIVSDMQKIEKSLTKKELSTTQFTLISLDPKNDTKETKQEFLKEHKLKRWHFLSGTEEDTRELAMLLNVRYRNEGEEIVHSNIISLLDKQGRLIYQRTGNSDLKLLVNKIRSAP